MVGCKKPNLTAEEKRILETGEPYCMVAHQSTCTQYVGYRYKQQVRLFRGDVEGVEDLAK
jgi:hypothetical protein